MINKETVIKVAQLSKLELTEQEIETFSHQLSDILKFIEKLEELDTENILPFYEINQQDAPLRKDVPEKGLSNQEALNNAPETDRGFFVVPRVVSAE